MAIEAYLGEIMLFAGNYAPDGWALCDGAELPVQSNEALYSIIGNIYGGDSRNFNLPDLRSRSAVGTGTGPNLNSFALGQTRGAPMVTLTTANIPPVPVTIQATIVASKADADSSDPTGRALALNPKTTGGDGVLSYSTLSSDTSKQVAMGNILVGTATKPEIPASAFSVLPPVLGLTYCICISGNYPAKP